MFPHQSKKPLSTNDNKKTDLSRNNLQNNKNGTGKNTNEMIGNHEDFLKMFNEYKNQEM